VLESFLLSGRAAELILLIVALEFAALWWRYRRGDGAPPSRWLSQLLAGAALVAALRLAQGGAGAEAIGLALAVGGVAHLSGYRQRWERRG
jgi:hypothetical protein